MKTIALKTLGFTLALVGVFGLCVESVGIMVIGLILSFIGGSIILKTK